MADPVEGCGDRLGRGATAEGRPDTGHMGLLRRRKAEPFSTVPAGYAAQPSHWDQQEQEWREGIAQHGWLVISVPGDGARPGFQFTTGLTERDLPELIVYGLGDEVGMDALNEVAQRMVDGARYADGEVVPDVLEGDYRTQMWEVTWLQDSLGAAFALYGKDRVRIRQLVIPDLRDRLPWEDEYADPDLQPLLFVAPNGQGPRRAGPEEAKDDGHEVPADWDLPQDPHLGVIVSGPVDTGDLPVLLVVHEHDGDWQVLDGVTEPDVETAKVLCLLHVVEQDPTLREVLRTLPVGHEASRDAVEGQWQYELCVDD